MSAETAPGEHGGVEEPYLTVLPNDTSLEIPDYESSDSDLGSDLDDLQDAEEEEEEEDGLSREQMQDLMRRCQIDDPPPVDDRQAKIIEKKRAAREKNALVEKYLHLRFWNKGSTNGRSLLKFIHSSLGGSWGVAARGGRGSGNVLGYGECEGRA